MAEDQAPAAPQAETAPVGPEKNQKPWLLFGLAILLALSLGATGYLAYQNRQLKNQLSKQESERKTEAPAQAPSPTPEPQGPPEETAKTLTYRIPAGWETTNNTANTLQAAYNPANMKPADDNDSKIGILKKRLDPLPGYATYAVISLKPYDGGSRHQFIYQQLGYTPAAAEENQFPDYYEKEYRYNGWSCLVLYGLGYSASGTTWGMCAVGSSQAIFIEGPSDQALTEEFLQTVKLL